MEIKLNGVRYTDMALVEKVAVRELYAFLEEWFNNEPYVAGHTSGSTGIPKEIRLDKEDMRASARLTNAFFRIDSGSVLLLCLPVSYIAGKMMVVRALEAGADLLVEPPSSRPFAGLDRQVDLAAVVPLQMETSLDSPEDAERLHWVRQIIIGGAPVSPVLEKRLTGTGAACFATYGMTETVSHVALRRIGHVDYAAVGEVYFTVDERDCLVIHAPHLKTRVFVTNDMVSLLDATHFQWLGRYDHVINSGGVKFFPEKIEEKLSGKIPCRFFISSLPDQRLGERIVLVLEGERWSASRMEWLRDCLHKTLLPYEVPKEIWLLPRFRETDSGKVIRDMKGAIPASGDGA